jgi:hypothetical protein
LTDICCHGCAGLIAGDFYEIIAYFRPRSGFSRVGQRKKGLQKSPLIPESETIMPDASQADGVCCTCLKSPPGGKNPLRASLDERRTQRRLFFPIGKARLSHS